jgi:hypothetical protein
MDHLLSPFWSALFSKFSSQSSLVSNLPKLEQFFVENLNGGNFLSGTDQPMYVDIHSFPMSSRLTMLEGSVYDKEFQALRVRDKCPTFVAWVERMQAHPLLKDVCAKKENFHSHLALLDKCRPGEYYHLSIEYLKQD